MLPIKFSAIFMIITYHQFDKVNCERFDIWGDLSTYFLIIGSDQNRWSFPLMRRTITTVYPDDFDNKSNILGGTIVRGIKHTNKLTNVEDCEPEVLLIDGGINEETATVRITSNPGCGLDSLVEFFVET